MMPDILPLDPELAHRRWVREFEWHLDLVPPLMDAIVTETLPRVTVSRGGSRFDRPQITGGGYFDTVEMMLPSLNVGGTSGGVEPSAAARDARALWGMVADYVRRVEPAIEPTRPAPSLTSAPNPDPLTARAIALETIGWLIDHAAQVEHLDDDDYRDGMFALIRQLRGRYGVFSHPRQPRRRCVLCGERAVSVVWVDAVNGSPKPVRAGRCSKCGQIYREEPGD